MCVCVKLCSTEGDTFDTKTIYNTRTPLLRLNRVLLPLHCHTILSRIKKKRRILVLFIYGMHCPTLLKQDSLVKDMGKKKREV